MQKILSRTAGRLICAGASVLNNESPGKQSHVANSDEKQLDRLKGNAQKSPPKDISPPKTQVLANKSGKPKGWDGLLEMYNVRSDESLSPEMLFVKNFTIYGTVAYFVRGAVQGYHKSVRTFMDNNDTAVYQNVQSANREMLKYVCPETLKGGLRASFKATPLFFIFMFTLAAVPAYRGKNGIVEFPIAGAVTIAFMKFNLGIKGMISGCLSGGLSGLLLGLLYFLISKLWGKDMSDLIEYNYKITLEKEELTAQLRGGPKDLREVIN